MENVVIFKQIPPTNSLKKCIEISLENLYLDIGPKELKHFRSQIVSYGPYLDVFCVILQHSKEGSLRVARRLKKRLGRRLSYR